MTLSEATLHLLPKSSSSSAELDLTPLTAALQTTPTPTIHVQLPHSPTPLTYATQIFSHLVTLGTPCTNVVLHVSTPYPPLYNQHDVVCVGGTFDRLHAGHRLLLTAAAWAARDVLRIGVTADVLLRHKKHYDLIASFEQRCKEVIEYASQVKSGLRIVVSELTDPAGPSAVDAAIQAIVVSGETLNSARAINETRKQNGLNVMAIIQVDVLDTQGLKLSSSALREGAAKEC